MYYYYISRTKFVTTERYGWWRILKDSRGWWRILKDSRGWWTILKDSRGWWTILKDSRGCRMTIKRETLYKLGVYEIAPKFGRHSGHENEKHTHKLTFLSRQKMLNRMFMYKQNKNQYLYGTPSNGSCLSLNPKLPLHQLILSSDIFTCVLGPEVSCSPGIVSGAAGVWISSKYDVSVSSARSSPKASSSEDGKHFLKCSEYFKVL